MRKLPNSVYISLHITDYCQNGCDHCIYLMGPQGKTYMTIDFIKDFAHTIGSFDFAGRVNISGGEPFNHPQIIEIIEELSSLSYDTIISTNGRFINSEKIKKQVLSGLLRWQRVQLRFSVDSYHHLYDPSMIKRMIDWDKIANVTGLRRGYEYTYKWTEKNLSDVFAFIKNNNIVEIAGSSDIVNAEWNLFEDRQNLKPDAVDFIVVSATNAVFKNNYDFLNNNSPGLISDLQEMIQRSQKLLDQANFGLHERD